VRAAGERFTVGDPLRALAALGVVGVHIFSTLPLTVYGGAPGFDVESVITEAGFVLTLMFPAGLLLFFVLSGYLITRPFTHAFIEGRDFPPVGRYLRNRVLRIVPLFWFLITVLLVAEWVFGWVSVFGNGNTSTSPVDAAALYGFVQNATDSPLSLAQLGPGWTLHVELVFYFLVPLAGLLIALSARRLGARGRCALVVVLSALIAVASFVLLAEALPADPHDIHWFPTTAYGFMPGVALGALEPLLAPRIRAAGPRRLVPLLLLALALAGLLAFALFARQGDPLTSQIFGITAVGLVVAACLVRQWSGAPAWKALDNPVLQWIGVRSYSVYLLHGTVIAALYTLPAGGPRLQLIELSVLAVGGTLALSALTYRYVERPFLGRRHHLAAEPSEPSEPAPRPLVSSGAA